MAYVDKIDPKIPEGRIIIREGNIILKDEQAEPSPIQLPDKWQDLIRYITDKGFSNKEISKMKEAYGVVADYKAFRNVDTYNYLRREFPHLSPQIMWWLLFDYYDILPSNRKVYPSDYDLLTLPFRNLLDDCMRAAKGKLGDLTISVEASSTAPFFRFLQKEGLTEIYQVKEPLLRKYFKLIGSEPAHLYRIGLFLARYAIEKNDSRLLSICDLFPREKSYKKVYCPLTKEERDKIDALLQNPDSGLSYRNRAVGVLILGTGLRKGDVRDMKLSDIDWENDKINLITNKTRLKICLPLRPNVGNAIYDYIKNERPKDAGSRLFVSFSKHKGEYSPIDPAVIVNQLYDLCGIRANGERRGTHLIRHNVADELMNQGNDVSVVSEILGHKDPQTTCNYLSANIEQLRQCALDISEFPISHKLYEKQ
jgi:integrase